MASDGEGSVTRWFDGLRAGDPEAARQLWGHYFAPLVRLPRARLRDAPRGGSDEEDAALSAFDSLCRGTAAGRFPRLDDRRDLWRVLVTITARKAADRIEHEGRARRGGGRGLSEAAQGLQGRPPKPLRVTGNPTNRLGLRGLDAVP